MSGEADSLALFAFAVMVSAGLVGFVLTGSV